MFAFSFAVFLSIAGVHVSVGVERSSCFKTGHFNVTHIGKSLQGYVFATHNVESPLDCTIECISDARCASFNLQLAGVPRVCELNKKSTTSDELEDRAGYMHYGTLPQNGVTSSCASSPCENGGRCIDGCLSAFQCACAEGFIGETCNYTAGDFSLIFPSRRTSYFARFNEVRQIHSFFTICLWLNFSQAERATFFSYTTAAENQVMALRYVGDGHTQFLLNGIVSDFYSAPLNDNVWHHVCITYHARNELMSFYVDGFLRSHHYIDITVPVIKGGGTLTIGQSQLVHGGDCDPDESFVGHMNRFNMYSHVLSSGTIYQLSKRCDIGTGSYLNWNDFYHKDVRLDLWPVTPSACHAPTRKFIKEPYRQNDIFANSTISKPLSGFTVSFWLRIWAFPVILFSYRVENVGAELFQFEIGWNTTLTSTILGTARIFKVSINPMVRAYHHVAITWDNNDGSHRVYFDGTLCLDITSFNVGETIPAGGSFYIGEKVLSDGTLDSASSFIGYLSGFNIWDRAFVGHMVAAMSKGSGREVGNIFSWDDMPNFTQGNLNLYSMNPIPSRVPRTDFKLQFPTANETNWVEYAGSLPNTTQVTACAWINPTKTYGAVFQYASARSADEFGLYIYSDYVAVAVAGYWRYSDYLPVTYGDSGWHFLCVRWTHIQGYWSIHYNGERVYSTTGLHASGNILEKGILVLGQEMDEYGGGFSSSEAFAGTISHVNFWNYVLTSTIIESMSRGCTAIEGNLVFWSNFKKLNGEVKKKERTSCTYADYTVSSKRDQYCENNISPESWPAECDSDTTKKALFDQDKLTAGNRWRCYLVTALEDNGDGLNTYDVEKNSNCYRTQAGPLTDID